MHGEEHFYCLPHDCPVGRSSASLMVRLPDGSVTGTLGWQRRDGQTEETHAYEYGTEWRNWLDQVCVPFLELPVSIVLGMLWLSGMIPIGVCVVVFYFLWSVV
ncbi:MAG TPA: hypothetical protein VFI90_01610 [Rubrobacter sp.]|nr:hypothetical protein [Rubrobacter sp.]